MAFPVEWGRKCELTIDNTKVASTQTNFPMILNEDTLPSEMFDADGSYPALNGGGDIRFSSDEDGATQLPCEVVSFVTNNDPANGTAEIWVKVASVSSSADTSIYVWYNKSGETQPASDATYGSEAVWSDYAGVWHLEEIPNGDISSTTVRYYDSTENSNDAKEGYYIDMDTDQSVDGILGKALSFGEGVDDHLEAADNASMKPGENSFSISGWLYIDNINQRYGAIFKKSTGLLYTTYTGFHLGLWGNNILGEAMQPIAQICDGTTKKYIKGSTIATYGTAQYHFYKMVINRSDDTMHLYVDGVEVGTGIDISAVGDLDNTTVAMFAYDLSRLDGDLDEIRWSNNAESEDRVSTEYNNQNSPSTFVTEQTPVTPGTTDFVIADVSSASSIENVVLARNGGDFVIDDTDSASSIENITLQLVGDFEIDDIDSLSSIDNIDLEFASGDFVVADIDSISSIEEITIEQEGDFVIDDVDSLSNADNIDLEFNGGELVSADIDSLSNIGNILLQLEGDFLIEDIESGSEIDDIILERNGGDFVVNDIDSVSDIDNIELSRNGGDLVIEDVDSISSIDEIGLIGEIVVDDVDSASSIDNIELEFNGGELISADMESASVIDNITLQFEGTLLVDDIDSGSSIEEVTLERNGGDFVVGDVDSLSNIANVELERNGGDLAVEDIDSASSIEEVTLKFQGDFVVDDAESLSDIDNIDLEFNGGEFIVEGMTSASSIDNIELNSEDVADLDKNNQLYIDSIGGKVLELGNSTINTWNTAGRPTGKLGIIGFNTTLNQLEIYAGSSWHQI